MIPGLNQKINQKLTLTIIKIIKKLLLLFSMVSFSLQIQFYQKVIVIPLPSPILQEQSNSHYLTFDSKRCKILTGVSIF